ncbi:MAG: DUF1206 domain-containing protein [Candidatus Devosia phytovorans]|uniref:DUF1206 domain-containing protein n=1 Tax=Candidatus Devosia phytovorans TaxID=3121372 RepID=A0AAJ5VTC4_9HYPH|nr:DUF1206 domain-containing protein [Devosia sp.]WEK03805.1 MAG: DUF1206 domain-containing protein [Devosia sp.]
MSNHFETLARLGYAARGVVYLLLGGLALVSAIWGGTAADGSSDALSTLLGLPFGRVLLGLVALGLVGHILWRLAQGLLNADNVDDNAQGYAGRIGSVVSAGANVFLALSAARMAVVGGGSGGEGGEQGASALLLAQPFGAVLLGFAAVGVIAAGLVQVWKGVTRDYRKRLAIPSAQSRLLDPVCRFGLAARGALIVLIGLFVFYAAISVSPEQAGGISDALDYVHALPFGPYLYGLAALGLVAFGAYSVVQGLYRRMDAPGLGDIKRAVPGV